MLGSPRPGRNAYGMVGVLDSLFNIFDDNQSKKIEPAEVRPAFAHFDANLDRGINQQEFNKVTEDLLYQMCFES